MADSLATPLPNVVSLLGEELGYGRGPAYGDPEHNTRQANAIEDCWKRGLRKFYHCGNDWSFLKPVQEVTIPSGATTFALPADFAGFEGKVVVTSPTDAVRWWKTPIVLDEDVVAQLAAFPSKTGRPEAVAQTPNRVTGPTRGQRWQGMVFPTTDQAYTIKVRFYLTGEALTDQMPYAYGGVEHAETLIASCLAAAEFLRMGTEGPRAREFERMLEVSKRIDRRHKPQTLGQNDNGGRWYDPGRGVWRDGWRQDFPAVSYNGVVY